MCKTIINKGSLILHHYRFKNNCDTHCITNICVILYSILNVTAPLSGCWQLYISNRKCCNVQNQQLHVILFKYWIPLCDILFVRWYMWPLAGDNPPCVWTHHIFWRAVMHHAGICHLKQQVVRQSSPRGDWTSSSVSTQVPPAVLKLPGQQGGWGGSNWRHTYRTGVYTRQVREGSCD